MSFDTNDSGSSAWGAITAAIFGMFFLCFAVGLVFGPREPDMTFGTLLGTIGFTLFLGCMTIGGIGVAAKKPWAERFNNRLFDFAALAIQAIFVRDLIISIVANDIPSAAYYYGTTVWIVVGGLMYWRDRGTVPRLTYSECSLWPLLLFLKAPVTSIVLFAIPSVLVVGGEWIGAKFQHPHIGAAVGFWTFLAVGVFVMYLGNRLTRQAKRDGLNN